MKTKMGLIYVLFFLGIISALISTYFISQSRLARKNELSQEHVTVTQSVSQFSPQPRLALSSSAFLTPTAQDIKNCDNPALLVSTAEATNLKKELDDFAAKGTLEKLFDITSPDTYVDCTHQENFQSIDMLDPKICESNPSNTHLALYNIGYVTEGKMVTKAQGKSLIAQFVQKYGAFHPADDLSRRDISGCGPTLIYRNAKNDAGVKFNVYKRLDSQNIILTPVLDTPDTISGE